MNALASIRQLWSGAGASSLGPAERASSPATSIPAAELRELNAALPGASAAAIQPSGSSFGGLLSQMVRDVNAKQSVAAQALQDLQSGHNVSLHQAMIAMEEAGVSFQLMVEVRNRLLDSYQELMRLQI
ncbi:MAG: flagellar hook-basal body complex protein FliE [Verrucomicrobiota bacterium]|jgi:flagellar hook-basal body complex protein FliE